MFSPHARVILAFGCLLFSLRASGVERLSLAITPAGSSLEIPATLIKPDRNGPFPAVVIVHDCSGPGARSSGAPMRRAVELSPQGCVVLIPGRYSPAFFALHLKHASRQR